MKVGELKKLLEPFDDNLPVMTVNYHCCEFKYNITRVFLANTIEEDPCSYEERHKQCADNYNYTPKVILDTLEEDLW